jgi:putative addiction module killer protein
VNTILRTAAFDAWLTKLKDPIGKARIVERIRSTNRGQFGDCKPV